MKINPAPHYDPGFYSRLLSNWLGGFTPNSI